MSERKILEDCRKIPYNNKISGLWKEGTEMQRSNPREVAAEALMEIMTAGAYSNVALRRILRRNGAMTRQERAFVTETVNGTLRSLIYLDYLLNAFSSIPVEKMKPWLAAVVRTAAYQLIFMQVPDSAACGQAGGGTRLPRAERLCKRASAAAGSGLGKYASAGGGDCGMDFCALFTSALAGENVGSVLWYCGNGTALCRK